MPVYPVVVLAHEEAPGQILPPLILDFPDVRVLEFRFAVIDLPRLAAERFLNKGPAAAALSAHMRFEEPDVVERVLDFAVEVAGMDVTADEREPMLEYYSAYQALGPLDALKFEERVAIVQPESLRSKIMIWEQQFIRAGELKGMQQGLQKGIEQGLQQGIERGLRQGLREGEATVLLRHLRRKFGALSPETESTIRGLSTAQLEELAEAVLDFDSAAGLENWLVSHR